MRAPKYETNKYQFFILRAGSTIVRRSDNKSVYFQPGDDTAWAEENARHCFEHSEMFKGEHSRVFDQWASEYFA